MFYDHVDQLVRMILWGFSCLL